MPVIIYMHRTAPQFLTNTTMVESVGPVCTAFPATKSVEALTCRAEPVDAGPHQILDVNVS